MENCNSWKEKMPENVENSVVLGEKRLIKVTADRDEHSSEASALLRLSIVGQPRTDTC